MEEHKYNEHNNEHNNEHRMALRFRFNIDEMIDTNDENIEIIKKNMEEETCQYIKKHIELKLKLNVIQRNLFHAIRIRNARLLELLKPKIDEIIRDIYDNYEEMVRLEIADEQEYLDACEKTMNIRRLCMYLIDGQDRIVFV